MTNYERIMFMDEDELGAFLYGFPDNTIICKKNNDICNGRLCSECFRKWLDEEYEPKIADCPLCGSECKWTRDRDQENEFICCTNPSCLCRSYGTKEICYTKEEIIKRWNKR